MEYKTIDDKTEENVLEKSKKIESNNYTLPNKIYKTFKSIYEDLREAARGCKLRW